MYLNLVLEFVPETVYRASRHYAKLKQTMPMHYIKLYMYQLLRSLAYIHSVGICHRDIKPQNLLLNPPTGVLKLCDFGSAKILIAGEPNVSYICSRYYRAPELIFGATNYTTNIGSHFVRSPRADANCSYPRRVVRRVCDGRVDAGPAVVPGRVRVRDRIVRAELTAQNRPAGRDHQGAGHANARADQDDEPQLHGTQVPPDQVGVVLLPLRH